MHRLLVLLAAFLVACPSGDDEGTPVPVDDDDAGAPGNSSPTVPSISISPAAPGVDDDVVCSIETESVDPEGDEITYSFSWLLDDADAGVETSTLPSARTGAEEFWTCVVRASDGLLASGAVEATVEVGHVNQPPSDPVVEVSPASPFGRDPLLCAVETEAVDPEGAAVTHAFAWTRDGAEAGTGTTVDPDDTSEGEEWVCTVTASDGELESTASATVTIGPSCYSLELDGDGHVEVADDPLLRLAAGDFTVEAWVRRTGTGGTQHTIVYKRGTAAEDGWGLFIANESAVSGRVTWAQSKGGDPFVEADSTQIPGSWMHVALTFEADGAGDGTATLWIDGEAAGTDTLPTPDSNSDAALQIGRDGAFDAHYLDGRIDDVHISSVARYAAPFTPPFFAAADDDTLALWRLEAGSGAVAHDSGPHQFDGTIVNGTWSTLSACEEAP